MNKNPFDDVASKAIKSNKIHKSKKPLIKYLAILLLFLAILGIWKATELIWALTLIIHENMFN